MVLMEFLIIWERTMNDLFFKCLKMETYIRNPLHLSVFLFCGGYGYLWFLFAEGFHQHTIGQGRLEAILRDDVRKTSIGKEKRKKRKHQ